MVGVTERQICNTFVNDYLNKCSHCGNHNGLYFSLNETLPKTVELFRRNQNNEEKNINVSCS